MQLCKYIYASYLTSTDESTAGNDVNFYHRLSYIDIDLVFISFQVIITTMVVIIPELNKDNAISLSFGLKFKLIQVFRDGHKSEVSLMYGPKNGLFYGVFDEEDIDFEILADNQSNDKNIRFSLELLNTSEQGHSFFVEKGKSGKLKALETDGKHLHFVSQSTDEGKLLVATSARHKRIRYEEAAIKCSQIGFTVQVEKEPEVKGRKVQIFVINLLGQTITYEISLNNTVEDLKYLVYKTEDIPPEQQILQFSGVHLKDRKKISDYHIQSEYTLHLTSRLRGGDDRAGGEGCLGAHRLKDDIGERGVVCFAERLRKSLIN